MASLLHNKFMLAIIVIAVLAVGWYMLSGSGAATPTLVTTSANSDDPGEQLVSTLLQLRTVTLSGTIFSDPVFDSLTDFSTQIIPEPVGRTDPFAPVSGVQPGANDSGNTASQNSKLFGKTTK